MVEITDATVFEAFATWFSSMAMEWPPFRQFLAPLVPRILLLGAQFIVPKVTEYEPRIVPQTPHTDVDVKGEVVAIGLHLHRAEMGTMIAGNGHDFRRAATPMFAYDTGAMHYGPGLIYVPPPYPQFFTQRVFFLLCAATLNSQRITKHRHDNGFDTRTHTTRPEVIVDLGGL